MCLFIFGGGDEMEREPRMVETTLPGEQMPLGRFQTIAYDFSPCVVSGTALCIPKDAASHRVQYSAVHTKGRGFTTVFNTALCIPKDAASHLLIDLELLP
uniref:Uncharacterized protein n=1 Tax=Timema cristinae TaxID=61476 RepID=A0A7R9CPN0_TIMCR|nr:unnamed protein product [Timema cristinae]